LTAPAQPLEEQRQGVAQWAGFSLRADIGIEAEQREKLERFAHYVSRPAVSVERRRGAGRRGPAAAGIRAGDPASALAQ